MIAQQPGWSSSNYYFIPQKRGLFPCPMTYPLHQLPYLHVQTCNRLHPSREAFPARSSRSYAQKAVMPNRPLPTRSRIDLSPRLLRVSSSSRVEQHRHPRLGDYSRKSSLYGERCSNFKFVRRGLKRRRATLRGMHNLGLRSLHFVFFFWNAGMDDWFVLYFHTTLVLFSLP